MELRADKGRLDMIGAGYPSLPSKGREGDGAALMQGKVDPTDR